MEGEKDRIREFYYQLWLRDQKVPLDAPQQMYLMAGERKFRGRRLLILFTRLGIRARLSSSDLGRLSTHRWISPLWLGGKL